MLFCGSPLRNVPQRARRVQIGNVLRVKVEVADDEMVVRAELDELEFMEEVPAKSPESEEVQSIRVATILRLP